MLLLSPRNGRRRFLVHDRDLLTFAVLKSKHVNRMQQ